MFRTIRVVCLSIACVAFFSHSLQAVTRLDDGTGAGLVFTGHFNGANQNSDILTYYTASQNWAIRAWDGKGLASLIVGNTAGFGNLDDGRPMWSGDFDGDGRTDILFYYPGDGNWWLGSYRAGSLTWRLASNTSGANPGDNNFGNLTRSSVRIWTGNFTQSNSTQVLFYYTGDSNWWLGTWNGSQFDWSLADNTAGFGKLTSNQFFIDNFDGNGLSEIIFYAPVDSRWWLGTFGGHQLSWRSIGTTTGFGLVNSQPMWSGDFEGRGKAAMMFYSPGDHNWWAAYLAPGQLQWALVGNTTGFGNVVDGRPIYLASFTTPGKTDVVFFNPGDSNWWLGQFSGDQLNWTLADNTSGFGPASASTFGKNTVTGDFSTALTQFTWFSAGDKHVWLGSFSGTKLNWKLASAPVPDAPTNLTLVGATENTVSLIWTNNNALNDAVYTTHVERATAGSPQFQEIALLSSSAEQLTDFGLTKGTLYSYRVRSATPLDYSGYSNLVSARPEPPPPAISSFRAGPASINAGQTSTLTFSVTGATSVQIDHGIGSVPASGSRSVAPASTTTYTLTATGPGGTVSAQATVSVTTAGTIAVSMGFGAVTSTPYQCSGQGTVTLKSNNASVPSVKQNFSYSGYSSNTSPACQTTLTFQNLQPGNWSATDGRQTCSTSLTAGQYQTIKIWNGICQ